MGPLGVYFILALSTGKESEIESEAGIVDAARGWMRPPPPPRRHPSPRLRERGNERHFPPLSAGGGCSPLSSRVWKIWKAREKARFIARDRGAHDTPTCVPSQQKCAVW